MRISPDFGEIDHDSLSPLRVTVLAAVLALAAAGHDAISNIMDWNAGAESETPTVVVDPNYTLPEDPSAPQPSLDIISKMPPTGDISSKDRILIMGEF